MFVAPSTLIRSAREDASMTQTELARAASTSQPALARYENGSATPSLPTLERILAATGRSLVLGVSTRSRSSTASSIRAQPGENARRLRKHRRRVLDAARANGLANVRVFGSSARGEDVAGSDIDLLVDTKEAGTLLDVVAFGREAAEILETKVDVATADMMKPRARARALKEAVPL